ESFVEQELERRGLPLDRPFAMTQSAALDDALQLLREDASHQVARERFEHDDVVEPIHELWTKALVDRAHDLLVRERARIRCEPESGRLMRRRAEIPRQNDDRVAEVRRAPGRIGGPSV